MKFEVELIPRAVIHQTRRPATASEAVLNLTMVRDAMASLCLSCQDNGPRGLAWLESPQVRLDLFAITRALDPAAMDSTGGALAADVESGPHVTLRDETHTWINAPDRPDMRPEILNLLLREIADTLGDLRALQERSDSRGYREWALMASEVYSSAEMLLDYRQQYKEFKLNSKGGHPLAA